MQIFIIVWRVIIFLQGIYNKAEELYEYSLKITKDKKVIARCYNNLAFLYQHKEYIKCYNVLQNGFENMDRCIWRK